MSNGDTDLMIRERQLQREQRSPALRQIEAEEQEAIKRRRQSVQLPEWLGGEQQKPIEEITPEDDAPASKEVELTGSDDFLPYLDDIRGDHDTVQMILDDEDQGRSRADRTYSNEYMKPNRRTIRGIDMKTGVRHLNIGDYNVPGVEEHTRKGVELIGKANMSADYGPDEKGLQGAAHVATAIQLEGGSYADLERALDQTGIPKGAARVAWNAAARASIQQAFDEELSAPTPQEELDAIEADPLPDLTTGDLINNSDWLDSALYMWEAENGAKFSGSKQELVDWSLNEMSNFNWRILGAPGVNGTSMAYYATQATLLGGDYAKALLNLIDMYDRVETDLGIVKRSLGAAFSDPTMYAGLGFGKGAAWVSSKVMKNRLKKWLVEGAMVGAGEGAIYAGGEDLARQAVEKSAGAREEIDPGQAATSAAIGAGVGAAVGPVIGAAMSPKAVDFYRRTGAKMRQNARYTPRTPMTSQVGAVYLAGKPDRISTRLPTAVKATEDPMAENLVISIDAMEASGPAFKKNADFVREYDNYRPTKKDLTDREVMERFKSHIVDNLLWLHDQMRPEVRARAKLWYDGARRQTEKWSQQYGLENRQVAAVIASLSPQKDWFMNMSLAERMMDIWSGQQKHTADDAMDAAIDKIIWMGANGKRKTSLTDTGQKSLDLWNMIKGARLEDVAGIVGAERADYAQAMWVRAYDEAYHPRHHRVISPEGDMMDLARNADGSVKGTGWGSFGEIGKAISVLRDGSLENVSRQMGGQHKARNFYSNIVSPDSDLGEVTIDTHAVAAALLKPLSGKGYEVDQNFGSSSVKGRPGGASSSITGAKGMYGVYADAYREAAKQRGILPREMQSIVWEEVRTLFTDTWKNDKNLDAVSRVWQQYRNGRITQSQAREKIYELAGGTGNPAWYGRSAGLDEGGGNSTYKVELPGGGVSRGAPGDDGGTAGESAPGGSGEVAAARSVIEASGKFQKSMVDQQAEKLLAIAHAAKLETISRSGDKAGLPSDAETFIANTFEPVMAPLRERYADADMTDSELIDQFRAEIAKTLGGKSKVDQLVRLLHGVDDSGGGAPGITKGLDDVYSSKEFQSLVDSHADQGEEYLDFAVSDQVYKLESEQPPEYAKELATNLLALREAGATLPDGVLSRILKALEYEPPATEEVRDIPAWLALEMSFLEEQIARNSQKKSDLTAKRLVKKDRQRLKELQEEFGEL